MIQCNNREKVLLASPQLIGPAANWWDASKVWNGGDGWNLSGDVDCHA
jgi:hypothetical protein